MLVRDVILIARDILQDVVADEYRYPDESLLRLYNLWQVELRRGRPDAFIGMFHLPLQPAAAMGDDIVFPEMFVAAAAKYVAGMAEARDDEFTTNGRAMMLINAAKQEVGIR